MTIENNKGFSAVALIIVVALIAVGVYFWTRSSSRPATQQESASVDAEQMAEEVGAIDLGNLDADFQSIDADLNQL